MSEDFVVTINDARKAGYCVRGVKRWGEAAGLNFADFLKNGIAASALLATGDACAITIVEKARARHGGR